MPTPKKPPHVQPLVKLGTEPRPGSVTKPEVTVMEKIVTIGCVIAFGALVITFVMALAFLVWVLLSIAPTSA